MSIEDGGPAFPVLELSETTGQIVAQHFGANLRDLFAIEALAAIIAVDGVNRKREGDMSDAKRAYQYADVMLEARKQESWI